MATDFGSYSPPSSNYAIPKRYISLLVPQTSVSFVGLAVASTKVTVNFDRIPILTGAAATPGGWSISGGVTISAVAVVGTTVELTTSAISTGTYTLSVPTTGITSDSGADGSPYPYSGPATVVFGATASGGSGALLNTGLN